MVCDGIRQRIVADRTPIPGPVNIPGRVQQETQRADVIEGGDQVKLSETNLTGQWNYDLVKRSKVALRLSM